MNSDSSPDRIRYVHSLTGLLPLTAFAVWHTWQVTGAVAGRSTFVARLGDGDALALGLETAVVMVPLGVHVALGAVRVRGWLTQRAAVASSESRGTRILQAGSGVVLLGFLAIHLAHTWFPRWAGVSASELYDRLNHSLGQPALLACYLLGVTALVVHVAQGITTATQTWGIVKNQERQRVVRAIIIIVASAIWITSVNAISHFAAGRALLWSD